MRVSRTAAGSSATVAGTIGVALDLLDTILSGQHADAPAGIAVRARLPKGHWIGERAARDVLWSAYPSTFSTNSPVSAM